jgi:hypothetical protein
MGPGARDSCNRGRLACRCPAVHVVVASRELAICGGEPKGLAAACNPHWIMIDPVTLDAADTHPNGRCQRPGCAQLFAQAISPS